LREQRRNFLTAEIDKENVPLSSLSSSEDSNLGRVFRSQLNKCQNVTTKSY
jgi:hypothetical protein